MLNEWIRNLPLDNLQEITSKARPSVILTLALLELDRRQRSFCSAAE
jgi:hypothetical protein